MKLLADAILPDMSNSETPMPIAPSAQENISEIAKPRPIRTPERLQLTGTLQRESFFSANALA